MCHSVLGFSYRGLTATLGITTTVTGTEEKSEGDQSYLPNVIA